MRKTTTEKIDSIKNQIQQLENERKRLMNQQKETERKARTKRLIERGAILESFISGADKFTNEQIKSFLEKTVQSESVRIILDNLTSPTNESVTEKSPWTARNSGIRAIEKSSTTEQGDG